MSVADTRKPEERVSFQLDTELLKAVEALAFKGERTLSAEIRLALRRHVERENGNQS